MADDSRVRWQLATPFGIQVNEEKNMWHSGHVNDIIPLTDVNSILVATETGGIWLVDQDNGSVALSTDWDVPDVKCMAMGPDGTRRVIRGLYDRLRQHRNRFSIEERPESIGFLFAGSDGGVAKVNLDNLEGENGPSARSDFDENLPTLQCYSMLYRQFTGSVDIFSQLNGVLVAGLQDNGNVSCRFRPTATPWQHVDLGDGGLNTSVPRRLSAQQPGCRDGSNGSVE